MRYTHPEMASSTETVSKTPARPMPSMAPAAERVSAALLCLVFLFGAAVQYNDPDPLRWAAIYLAAAAVAAGHALRPMPPLPSALVAAVSLIWAVAMAPDALRTLPSGSDIAGDFKMMSPGVEEAREALGLLIIAIATGVLAFRARARMTQAGGTP